MFYALREKFQSIDRQTSMLGVLAILISMAFSAYLAADMYVPSLPTITRYFGVDATLVQLSISIYLIGMAVTQLFLGPLSDRFGRRPIILMGLIVFIAGSVVCTFASTINVFILGRLIQSMGVAAGLSLARIIMRDMLVGRELARVSSYIAMTVAIAPAIAPLLGSYFDFWFGWRSVFEFLILYALVLFFIVFYFLPETNKNLNHSATQLPVILKTYGELISNKLFMSYVLSTSAAVTGIIVYYTISPFLLQSVLHVPIVEYGWLALAITSVLFIGRYFNTILIGKFNLDLLIFSGLCLMFASSLLMLAFAAFGIVNVGVIVIPMIFYMLGTGVTFSNAMSSAFSLYKDIIGSAGALYGCVQIIVPFIASIFAAHVSHQNQFMMAVILSVVSGGIAVLFYFAVFTDRSERLSI